MENQLSVNNESSSEVIQKDSFEEYHLSVIIPNEQKVHGQITVNDIKNAPISILNKEILVARFSEKQIKDLEANYAGERIKTAINLAVFTVGFKVENLSELIILVIKDIFYDFSYLTIPEIELAFRMGARRKFEPIMGMSVMTFYGWLVSYTQTVKTEAVKSLNTIKETPVEIDEKTKKKYYNKWLNAQIQLFEQYKKDKSINVIDMGNVFYDYCEKKGICYLSVDEKSKLYEEAKISIKGKHHRREAKSNVQAQNFKAVVEAINANDIDVSLNNRIVSEAKRLAITKIFDKLIQYKLELVNLISAIESEKKQSNEGNQD